MRDEPIEAEELRRAKDHLKGATLLALEGSGARMSSLARYHMYFDRHFTSQELIAMLEAVTAEEVQQIAAGILPARPHRRKRGRQPQRLPAHSRPTRVLIGIASVRGSSAVCRFPAVGPSCQGPRSVLSGLPSDHPAPVFPLRSRLRASFFL